MCPALQWALRWLAPLSLRRRPDTTPARRPSSPQARQLVALRDLLHGPAVSVGVLEEDEPPPRELLDLAGLHAALEEVRAGGVGVGDDELQALDRARLGLHDPGADRDRARRARGRELHEAHLVADAVVVVGVEADLIDVEGLG